jgi:hypothetical protein
LIILSNGTGTTMIETRYTGDTTPQNSLSNFIFYSNKIGYFSTYSEDGVNTENYVFQIDLDNKANTPIYHSQNTYSPYNNIWLFKNKNAIYFYKVSLDTGTTFNLSFGLIDGVTSYETELGSFTATYFLESFCYPNVITKFNKNYVFIQNQNTLFSLDFTWNPNNYNGQPYISSASLVPNVITIEDENEEELFNRNIYNLSSYANWYTASVEIPNYYLNNEQLFNTCLYSKANNLMASKNIDTTKNIYEELIINFTNRFKVIDNGIENLYLANEIVDSMINRITSSYLGKYQINYNDNTSEIKPISTEELTYTDLKTTIKLVIYTNKLIDTIDLLSQDELITYKTINCSNLDLNKYYLIKQDIRIE